MPTGGNKVMKYDVVVVGSGPGGCMAAKRLAELGIDVLLIEKRPEIGVPVRCAEATGIKGLKELGIELDKRYIASVTRGAYVFSPDGTKIDMTGKEYTGYILERRIFDKYLAILAAKAGAEVLTRTYAYDLKMKNGCVSGVMLKRFSEKFEVKCKAVVAADGIESKIGRKAGLNTTTKVGEMTSNVQFEMAGIDIEPEIMELYFGNKVAPGGYAWVFPKGEDIANVGLGVRKTEKRAIDYLREFINSKEHLKKGKVCGMVVGGVPVQGPIDKSYGNGIVLVGDSARQVDPLTGGGIHNAMKCGIIAAETLAYAAEKGDFSEEVLSEYERRWGEEVGKVLQRSLKIKLVLEKMNDEDMNALAKLLARIKFGSIDLKDISKSSIKLPPEIIEFVQNLM
ncbi:MAG: hypothetical protein DRN25_00935 [Thermoplasmata archaeon]|nr:MAG: hypothetical protein DRN25_00935 [Thermoplasmata archaeon]